MSLYDKDSEIQLKEKRKQHFLFQPMFLRKIHNKSQRVLCLARRIEKRDWDILNKKAHCFLENLMERDG